MNDIDSYPAAGLNGGVISGSGLRNPVDYTASEMAMQNFRRIFAINPQDKVLILADRNLDPKVVDLIWSHAAESGAAVCSFVRDHAATTFVQPEAMSALETATFVASTWHRSVLDPMLQQLRSLRGQRWVKLTYFRTIEALQTEQASFPIDLLSVILLKTAACYPSVGGTQIKVTDTRGSDLQIDLGPDYIKHHLTQSRWRGQLTTELPGSYVHYLPTHGPNLYDCLTEGPESTAINGMLYPGWGVGFDRPFASPVGLLFEKNKIVEVTGSGPDAEDLRILLSAPLIELGCGFNPKAPRKRIYPAGSNSPGAMHFGIDSLTPGDLLLDRMPLRPHDAGHFDLVSLDATVTFDDKLIVDNGFLVSLRDDEVVEKAREYGDPKVLLEDWPDW
jgi:hypothetical protein